MTILITTPPNAAIQLTAGAATSTLCSTIGSDPPSAITRSPTKRSACPGSMLAPRPTVTRILSPVSHVHVASAPSVQAPDSRSCAIHSAQSPPPSAVVASLVVRRAGSVPDKGGFMCKN
eukprot:1225695-Rhodomonas_salina.1